MSKLEITSRQGNFVHENQQMAANKGFACVSRIWYDKTKPLSEGIDAIIDASRQREDIECPLKHMQLKIDDSGKLVMEYIDGREFAPTEHAWRQLATWAYVPHTIVNELRKDKEVNGKTVFKRDSLDETTLLTVFKNGLRRQKQDKQFLFRTYKDGTMRAVLSERYAIVNNVWYLETLQKLFKEMGGEEPRLSHWRGDADTIYGNLLIPDTCRADKDSDYGGMISMSNCEIGLRRLSQYPSVFRAICMNGCIWDQSKGNVINKVHRGEIDFESLRTNIVTNIHSQIPLLQSGIDRFMSMKNKVIDKTISLKNVFAEIGLSHGLSGGLTGQVANIVNKFATFESDNRNMFGVVNAITRASQDYSPNEWVRMDVIAGEIMTMNNNQWGAFLNRAKNLQPKQLEKVYGVAV